MVPFYSIFPRRSAVNADFLFSSRRRHTRYIGDCSSDVCSSDLSMASSSWKKEPDFVKQEYRRLASEAKSRHLKLYSNQIPCRKRNKKIRNVTQSQLTSLQIIPQYPQLTQSRSEDSTAVSSPVTSSPEMSLPEEISRVSHIPYGLTDNESVGFYLPKVLIYNIFYFKHNVKL